MNFLLAFSVLISLNVKAECQGGFLSKIAQHLNSDVELKTEDLKEGDLIKIVFTNTESQNIKLKEARVLSSIKGLFIIQDIQSAKVHQSSLHSKLTGRILKKAEAPDFGNIIRYKDEIASEITSNPGEHYVIYVDHGDSRNVLVGRAFIRKNLDGTPHLELQSINGVTHYLDLNYNQILVRKLNSNPLNNFDPKLQLKKAIDTRDPNEGSRLEMAQKLGTNTNTPFSNPAFYLFYEKHPYEVEDTLRRWYQNLMLKGNPDALKLFENYDNAKKTLPPHQLVLFMDPGIANRSSDFLDFAIDFNSKNPKASAPDLREAYSKKLGNQKVYRALNLNESDMQNIKSRGMLSTSMIEGQNTPSYLLKFFSPRSPVYDGQSSPLAAIEHRIGYAAEISDSIFLSTSSYSSIASSLAFHSSAKSMREKAGKTYLFELLVPKLNVIEQIGLFKKRRADELKKQTELRVGSEKYDSDDPGIEQFIFLYVPPSQIHSVSEITNTPPPYKWQ